MLNILVIVNVGCSLVYLYVLFTIFKSVGVNYKILDEKIDELRSEHSHKIVLVHNKQLMSEEREKNGEPPQEGDVVHYNRIVGYETPNFGDGQDRRFLQLGSMQMDMAALQQTPPRKPIYEEGIGLFLKEHQDQYLVLKEDGEIFACNSIDMLPNSYKVDIKFNKIPTKEEETEGRLKDLESKSSKIKYKKRNK